MARAVKKHAGPGLVVQVQEYSCISYREGIIPPPETRGDAVLYKDSCLLGSRHGRLYSIQNYEEAFSNDIYRNQSRISSRIVEYPITIYHNMWLMEEFKLSPVKRANGRLHFKNTRSQHYSGCDFGFAYSVNVTFELRFIQRWYRRWRGNGPKLQEKRLAFMECTHGRLGAQSGLSVLDSEPGLIKAIAMM
jgi:hypothetical protein